MSRTIHERRYTFSEAAAASGVAPKVIRNWIDRGQVRLSADTEREGQKWRRFSMFDVLRLALTKRLNDFGVPVSVACLMGSGATPSRIVYLYENEPPPVLAEALSGTIILAWRSEEGWDGGYLRGPDSPPIENLPDTVLHVDVGRVAETVAGALATLDARSAAADDDGGDAT